MGRGIVPVSEVAGAAIQDLARQVAEAIVAGDFETARTLTEDAIRATAARRHQRGTAR